MRSNASTQPFIGLNFLNEYPAQSTLLRGIAHVFIKYCHVAHASKQLLALWLIESSVGTLIKMFGMAKPHC